MNTKTPDQNKDAQNPSGPVSSPTPAQGEEAAVQETSTVAMRVAETPQVSKGSRKSFARKREFAPSEFVEQVVAINRVTKVTKGGKKLSFSALVVVGDTKGRVGYNLNKANEVATAIKKALASAKRNMIRVSLNGLTIPHQIDGKCGAALVMLKPAAPGTGVIAAGPVRAVCDAVGIRNILTKCHRSNNPINVVKATIDGLSRLKTRPVKEKEDESSLGLGSDSLVSNESKDKGNDGGGT
jgi:small subunit ribosomal protein S5